MGNNNNKEKNIKKSYYKLLNKNIKERYDLIRYDSFNQNFSLFQKDFEKNYVNQKIPIIALADHFIPWKSYLLHSLRLLEEEKAYIWAHSLYEIIYPENFPEQIKFQNLFFYQEQQILSNIKLKFTDEFSPQDYGYNTIIKGKEYLNNIDDPLLDIPQDPFNLVKNKISNNLMASFVSAGSESLNSSAKKDPNKEYHYNKSKIKEYMDIFKQHLSIKEHPINFVIEQFYPQFIPKVDEIINYYKNNFKDKKDNCNDFAKYVIGQLQEFMVLIQIVIKLFYSRSISYSYFKDEKDEFLNLVSFIIFNNDKIYKKYFELFELMNKENELLYEEKHSLLGELLPEEVGIKDEFCLNQRTKDLMEKLKKEKQNVDKDSNDDIKENNNDKNNNKLTFDINGEEKIIINEEEINTKENNDNQIDNNKYSINNNNNSLMNESRLTQENFKITSETGKLNIFTKELFASTVKFHSNEPYYEAILYIKNLIDFKVPLEKLVFIASLSGVITGCVNKYWKNMEHIIKPEMLSIDSDELMTIFIYIIYKCNIPSLFVHADFIKYFTTPTTKAAMIGYYYITFQGCLEFLLGIKDKSDFKKESI